MFFFFYRTRTPLIRVTYFSENNKMKAERFCDFEKIK